MRITEDDDSIILLVHMYIRIKIDITYRSILGFVLWKSEGHYALLCLFTSQDYQLPLFVSHSEENV